MNEIKNLFKKNFDKLQSDYIDDSFKKLGIILPNDYVSFLKNYFGGYLKDDIVIMINNEIHGGIVFLGLSSRNIVENIEYYNKMRMADSLNQAEKYYTIMIIDGGEICIDIKTGKYFFFDSTYCEFNYLCSSFEELLSLLK